MNLDTIITKLLQLLGNDMNPTNKKRAFVLLKMLSTYRECTGKAEYYLSLCYYVGRYVKKDDIKGREYLIKSAKLGYPVAKKRLFKMPMKSNRVYAEMHAVHLLGEVYNMICE